MNTANPENKRANKMYGSIELEKTKVAQQRSLSK